MTLYILVINDLRNVGFNAKDVEVFTEVKKATERMRELYLVACKDCHITDPFDENDGLSMEHQFVEDGYAYVFGEYYFDIFKKEVSVLPYNSINDCI